LKYQELFTAQKAAEIPSNRVVGIDIGSRQAKAVLLANSHLYTALAPTGFFMKDTAGEILENLFSQSGLEMRDLDYIVATGYGRIALEFEMIPHRTVTEISCHGIGASYLGDGINTIIDIGGQDSKVIRIDPSNGRVLDFAMNDKCAAGTGRFLEKAANILGCDITDLGEMSMAATVPADISSQCVVFAESEIISGRAKGGNVHDLAAGVHLSVLRRVSNLLNRIGIEQNVLFTGGVSNNIGMKKALETLLGFPVATSALNAVFAGALGAAILAGQYAGQANSRTRDVNHRFAVDLTDLNNAVAKRHEDYIKKATSKRKNVAYLCTYTPVEIINSANVAHIRMLHAGNQKEVNAGEITTRSIFCDFTKASLGSFHENYPLYSNIDKAYTFYTCDCMRKTAEAMDGQFVPTSIFNLPRMTGSQSSRDYYVTELEGLVADLEKITKEPISKSDIRKNIGLYNRAKQLIRRISSLRKQRVPPLTSAEFQRIALSYYNLPPEELIVQYELILSQLQSYVSPEDQVRPIRLMLAGGIVADGDDKLTRLIEQEIGASIVIEDNCTGYSPFAKDVAETGGDVLEEIAAGYLGQAPCARMKPLSERIDFSAELALEYDVDGVIYYYMKFCPCYGMAKNEFLHRFQAMGIPVLEIPGDYSVGDDGQIKTRLEAFIEVLAERGACFV